MAQHRLKRRAGIPLSDVGGGGSFCLMGVCLIVQCAILIQMRWTCVTIRAGHAVFDDFVAIRWTHSLFGHDVGHQIGPFHEKLHGCPGLLWAARYQWWQSRTCLFRKCGCSNVGIMVCRVVYTCEGYERWKVMIMLKVSVNMFSSRIKREISTFTITGACSIRNSRSA